MIFIIVFYEILHDGARLKKSNSFSIRERIREGWNTSIGIDFEEPWFFLDILLDVNCMGFVWEAGAM